MILPAPKTETAEMPRWDGKKWITVSVPRQYLYKIEEKLTLMHEWLDPPQAEAMGFPGGGPVMSNVQEATMTRTATEKYEVMVGRITGGPRKNEAVPYYKGNPWGNFEMDPEDLNDEYYEERRKKAALGLGLVEKGHVKGIGGFNLIESAYVDVMLAFLWSDEYDSSKPGFKAHRDTANNLVTFEIQVITSQAEKEALVKEWEEQREWGKRFQEKLDKAKRLFPEKHQELLEKYAGGKAFGDMLAFEKEVDNLLGFGDMAEIQEAPFELEEEPEIVHETPSTGLLAPLPIGYIDMISAAPIQSLHEAISGRKFGKVEDSPYPTAILRRGNITGFAQLKPLIEEYKPLMPTDERKHWIDTMFENVKKMTDLENDILDILNYFWLKRSRKDFPSAWIDVDEILSMRGLKTKRGAGGRTSGYRREQRQDHLLAIERLQAIFITICDVQTYEGTGKQRKKGKPLDLKSRACNITDILIPKQDDTGQMYLPGFDMGKVKAFAYMPGQCLAYFLKGPGRQVARLSIKTVHYDPYRQSWEKRLGRYFTWNWKTQAKTGNYTQPFRVRTLLEAAQETINERFPMRTRNRLEEALDALQCDRIIVAWQYDDTWDENVTRRHEWAEKIWAETLVYIEPPDEIKEWYKKLERETEPKALPPFSRFGERLASWRKRAGLTQLRAAEVFSVHQTYISRLEGGKIKKIPPAIEKQLAELERQ